MEGKFRTLLLVPCLTSINFDSVNYFVLSSVSSGALSKIFAGVTCLIASSAERERGGTSKLAEAL